MRKIILFCWKQSGKLFRVVGNNAKNYSLLWEKFGKLFPAVEYNAENYSLLWNKIYNAENIPCRALLNNAENYSLLAMRKIILCCGKQRRRFPRYIPQLRRNVLSLNFTF